MTTRTEHLVDLLASATVEAAEDYYVNLQRMTVGREVETALFQHPPSSVLFPPLRLGEGAALRFACGMKESAWRRIRRGVRFTISVETDGRREQVFETTLDPRARVEDRRWQRHTLDLSRFAGRNVRLLFETKMAGGRSNAFAWAGWADPVVEHRAPARAAPSPRRDKHTHVFLVTADALPARALECYGHPRAKTPHLNSLAADGALFEEAWSQCSATVGSYASLLTGRYPQEHGVDKEWGTLPAHLLSLPVALHAHGHHTLMAAGEREIADPANGFARLFAESLPMLGNPVQDGAVTTRQVARRLAGRPDRPCFAWVHYFDTHPPSLPPEPFRSSYYSGDPTDPSRARRPEDVAKIRGVETVLYLKASMPLLEGGTPVFELIDILEETGAALRGRLDSHPDLAAHLLGLGRRAMNGADAPRFGEWLAGQAQELRRGRVPAALLKWFKDVLAPLEEVEAEILSWVRGVKDFDFPLSMHTAAVGYLDSQVGALIESLKELGIYEQSLFVFTAPHGELLDHPVLPFHHTLLAPETLRVPLVVKPPRGAGARATGARVGGVFDLIDIFPTVMEALGFAPPPGVSGVSRWPSVRDGSDIPPHDSFAVGTSSAAHSVYRPPHLLVRERDGLTIPTLHTVLSGGPEVVYDTASGARLPAEALAERDPLVASLDAWLPTGRAANSALTAEA